MATSGSHSHGPHGSSLEHGSSLKAALPEPRTPMWLPALGGVLFVAVAIYWASRPPEVITEDASAAAATATATATASAAPSAALQPARPGHPRRPAR